MLKEFKAFALRGNVIDLAIGVIIGVAFGAIVTSFVNDIVMPIIGLLVGGVDFSDLFINLGEGEYASLAAAREAGAPVIAYGAFINTIINFLIIAFAIFITINQLSKMLSKPAAPAAPAPPTKSEALLEEIRDLLKRK
jgi:large conductance mechanosensitive channel